MKNSVIVMDRFQTILLLTLLSWPKLESFGQDTTVSDQIAEIGPLSGDILILRGQSKKVEKLTHGIKVTPQDRVGTVGGSPGRISIDGGCMVTLKGVTATEGEGLSIDRVGKLLTVRLHHGRLLVETYSVDLAVETPHGHVGGKSVYFLAEVGRESTRIVAIDGELKVSNDLGSLDLGNGETVALRRGAEPAKAPPSDPDKDVAGVAALEEPFNLIKNPGFELDLKEWSAPRFANKAFATIDDTMAHGGRKSVRILLPNSSLGPPALPADASGNGDVALCMVPDSKVLKPGARYLLRLWIRTENFSIDGKAIPFSFLSKGLVLPDQPPGDGVSRCTCPLAEKKWTCARFVVVARPKNEKEPFGMSFPDAPPDRGVLSGTVWLDDFFLTPFPSKPEDFQLRESAVPLPAAPLDLLAMVKPQQDRVKGEWTISKDGLACAPATFARLQLPYQPPEEYDFTLVVERIGSDFALVVGLVLAGEARCQVLFDWDGISGVDMIEGKNAKSNETTHVGPVLNLGSPVTLLFSVRREGISVAADGKQLFSWKGLLNKLSFNEDYAISNPKALMVGWHSGGFRIKKIEIVPLSGSGRKLR
ncbi:MAG TPA: hypothetical protein VE981_09905 [Planctomycetota bacterium]|nr:hypothetical protein [Planctomycetota bacterium]